MIRRLRNAAAYAYLATSLLACAVVGLVVAGRAGGPG